MNNDQRYWYVYGAGGFGMETMDIVLDFLKFNDFLEIQPVFVEDNTTRTSLMELPVIDLSGCVPGSWVTIAVGEPKIRDALKDKATSRGLLLKAVVSPSAVVSASAEIGDGAIIAPMCSLQANSKVGANVAVNTMAIIGHDVCVDDGAVISSMVNLGGATHVGRRAYIGMGALVKECVTIGERAIISMGAVVFRDVPEGVIAVGNPARVSKRNENEKVFS